MLNFFSSPYTMILVLTGIIVIISMMLNVIFSKKLDIFDPFYLISLLYFLIFVIAPIVWIINGKTSWARINAMEHTIPASLIFIVGYCAFAFFYIFFKEGNRNINKDGSLKAKYVEDEEYVFNVAVWAWIAFTLTSILAFVHYAMRGVSIVGVLTFRHVETIDVNIDTGFTATFMGLFSRGVYSSVVVLYAFQKKHRWTLIIPLFIAFMIAFSSGWRNQIMMIVLAPIVYYYLSNKKRPKISSLIILFIIVYFIAGAVGVWRSAMKSGAELPSLTLNNIFNSFMVNIEVFFPFYHMVGWVHENFSHQYVIYYLKAIVQFIPRAIWPGKPTSPMANYFISIYGPSAASGPAFPNIGEMFLDFGILGVVIGMGLYGFFAKKFYSYAKSDNKWDWIIFSIFIPYQLQYITRGHFPSVAMETIALFAVVWIIKFLTSDIRIFHENKNKNESQLHSKYLINKKKLILKGSNFIIKKPTIVKQKRAEKNKIISSRYIK